MKSGPVINNYIHHYQERSAPVTSYLTFHVWQVRQVFKLAEKDGGYLNQKVCKWNLTNLSRRPTLFSWKKMHPSRNSNIQLCERKMDIFLEDRIGISVVLLKTCTQGQTCRKFLVKTVLSWNASPIISLLHGAFNRADHSSIQGACCLSLI